MKIIPNSNRILVQQIKLEQDKTESGLVLPKTLDVEAKTQGKVLEVGKEMSKFKKGMICFYGQFAGEKIKIMEKNKEVELVLLTDEDVLGWIK